MDTLQSSGGEVHICVLFSSLSCSCRRANDRVSEPKYPVLCREGSGTPVVLGKIKRIKSLQPKPLEEEVARSLGVWVCVWGGGGGGGVSVGRGCPEPRCVGGCGCGCVGGG